MRIINLKTRNIFEYTPNRSGETKSTCPECSHTRKKQKDKCFSWNVGKSTGYCHNCEGSFVEYKPANLKDDKEYKKPIWKNITSISDVAVKWFEEKRGISQSTLNKMKIYSDTEFMPQHNSNIECICFPFFLDDVLYNIKYRAKNKAFKLSKDAELIFYNLDVVKEFKEIIIVEGEIDALSFIESGIKNVISVPNGANKNLVYLDNYIDLFDDKKIIVGVDNDLKGFELRSELIRRFGAENCSTIDYKDCKDANEYLIKYGKLELRILVDNKMDVPIDGIVDLDRNFDNIYNLFVNGLQPANKIGDDLDKLVTWETGRLAVWTGIPSHGKSEVVDWVNVNLNVATGWKMAYFSPENFPVEYHFSKLFSKISGKSFSSKYVNYEEFKVTFEHIKNNFFFLMPEDNFTIDTILQKAKFLIRKHGIKVLTIDPFNKIEHKKGIGQTETDYISELLDKLINFARINDILIHLVAHPKKMPKDKSGLTYEIPTLYDISGSANFYNKADYGITIYRHWGDNPHTDILVQKVKFRHLGEGGKIEKKFNSMNGRLEPMYQLEPVSALNNMLNKETEQSSFEFQNYWNNEPQRNQFSEEVPF